MLAMDEAVVVVVVVVVMDDDVSVVVVAAAVGTLEIEFWRNDLNHFLLFIAPIVMHFLLNKHLQKSVSCLFNTFTTAAVNDYPLHPICTVMWTLKV